MYDKAFESTTPKASAFFSVKLWQSSKFSLPSRLKQRTGSNVKKGSPVSLF